MAGIGIVTLAAFWTGLPVILAGGATVLALDVWTRLGRLPSTAAIALVISGVLAGTATWLAFTG
jgi:hypothetical protein